MQREAEERVRQMHAKAQQYTVPPLTVHKDDPPCQSMDKPLLSREESGLSNDRMLILVIAILLIKNDAKLETILALLYLIL